MVGKCSLLIWLSVSRKETELDNGQFLVSRKGGQEPRLAGEAEDVRRGVDQQDRIVGCGALGGR